MAVTYTCVACPADCENSDLPSVSFAECVDSLESELSEIQEIFLSIEDGTTGLPLAGPSDWTDLAAWQAVIADTGAAKVRRLIVIGDKPESESTTRTVSKGRKVPGKRTHTINADVDDVNNTNYDFMRRLQCGSTVNMWYATASKIYGGANGFTANVTKANPILERGAESYSLFRFQFQWDNACDPPRADNPFAV